MIMHTPTHIHIHIHMHIHIYSLGGYFETLLRTVELSEFKIERARTYGGESFVLAPDPTLKE